MRLAIGSRTVASMRTGHSGNRAGDDSGKGVGSHSAPVPLLLLLASLVALLIWTVLDPFRLSPVVTGLSLPTLVLRALGS